jgi:hypothetical protein
MSEKLVTGSVGIKEHAKTDNGESPVVITVKSFGEHKNKVAFLLQKIMGTPVVLNGVEDDFMCTSKELSKYAYAMAQLKVLPGVKILLKPYKGEIGLKPAAVFYKMRVEISVMDIDQDDMAQVLTLVQAFTGASEGAAMTMAVDGEPFLVAKEMVIAYSDELQYLNHRPGVGIYISTMQSQMKTEAPTYPFPVPKKKVKETQEILWSTGAHEAPKKKPTKPPVQMLREFKVVSPGSTVAIRGHVYKLVAVLMNCGFKAAQSLAKSGGMMYVPQERLDMFKKEIVVASTMSGVNFSFGNTINPNKPTKVQVNPLPTSLKVRVTGCKGAKKKTIKVVSLLAEVPQTTAEVLVNCSDWFVVTGPRLNQYNHHVRDAELSGMRMEWKT